MEQTTHAANRGAMALTTAIQCQEGHKGFYGKNGAVS
jgi:hypothetical protein